MLSVVIPCYTKTPQHANAAYNCIKSLRHVDELIVVEDGGNVTYLHDLSHVYIYYGENQGFTKAVNAGWKLATGDYVAIVNSDTFIESGDIRDLCIPDTVTHPMVIGHPEKPVQFGAFFVVPRSVFRYTGYLDEQFKMYYSDDDYLKRLEVVDKLMRESSTVKEVPTVVVRHAYGYTTNTNPEYYKKISEEDRIRFKEKWHGSY